MNILSRIIQILMLISGAVLVLFGIVATLNILIKILILFSGLVLVIFGIAATRLNKLKEILIWLSGVVLVLLGTAVIFYVFVSEIGNEGRHIVEVWRKMLWVSSLLFIISGFSVFSFKEWSRKLAMVSYVIVLPHLVMDNIVYYYLFFWRDDPRYFISVGTIFLIVAFFLYVLFSSKEQFQSKKRMTKE